MPKTKLGRWSVILTPAIFILFFIGTSLADALYASVSAGNTLLEDIVGRPLLTTSMLLGFGSGIAAFVTGLIAILKQNERAVLVFISTLIGAALIVFLIAELAFPH